MKEGKILSQKRDRTEKKKEMTLKESGIGFLSAATQKHRAVSSPARQHELPICQH